ncbi:hypothetical protein [Campylobacter sp. US33a]|uniref:Periplasmic protein n=1 Tax=Campylobacter sp. CCS1377 TaxID=3158229 RepID=A0AAU7E790_9BACT|nr:hypothetical protein [Campylobacter sp. US33a]MCW1360200.1 hypothetical protein [Campylobacter jejuni]TEY00968.1 hypothetical protein ELQ16_08275 [Campylobacter sp. US33a]
MVFLIFFLIVIILLFGIDYLYFNDENVKIKTHQQQNQHQERRIDINQTPYLNQILKNNNAQK